MSENKTFLMIAMPMIGIFDDPQELFNELTHRPFPNANVVRLNDIAEANFLAFQRYGIAVYSQCQDGTLRPMSLPVTGKYILSPLALEKVEDKQIAVGFSTLPNSQPINFGGSWGISAMNSFGAGFDMSAMVSVLLQESLIYPTANWFSNFPDAITWAQGDYVRRFYSRFVGTAISPRIPSSTQMLPGRMFIDADYASNEKNRINSEVLARLLSYGLIA